jgi:hypothetical protein
MANSRYLRAAYIGALTPRRFKLMNQMYYCVSLTFILGSSFGNSEVITTGPLTCRPILARMQTNLAMILARTRYAIIIVDQVDG